VASYHDRANQLTVGQRSAATGYDSEYVFDGLGSVTEVVDSSENTQNSYRYEAWGQVKSSTQNITNPYRYVGAYGVHWDASAALYFMQARYYKASVGRFITPDPVRGARQDPLSLHRYLYVSNNPNRFIDANGCSGEAVGELGRCIAQIIGISDVAPSLGVIAGCAAACGGLWYLAGIPGLTCFILCLGLRAGLGYIVGLRVCGRLVAQLHDSCLMAYSLCCAQSCEPWLCPPPLGFRGWGPYPPGMWLVRHQRW